MGVFSDQLPDDSVVDYRALAGSIDGPAVQAWDPLPLTAHDNLVLHPASLEVGRRMPAADCSRDWQTLEGQLDVVVPFDLFQSPQLYPEEPGTGHTVFHDDTSIEPSQTMTTSYSIHNGSPPYPVLGTAYDDAARGDAQEDKRQRNTAASARFRIKKRLRGEALENSVKKEQIKIARLEADIVQLEIENKWLRGLLTEKMEKNGDAKS